MPDVMSPREDAWRSLFHSFEETLTPTSGEEFAARRARDLEAAPSRSFSFFRSKDMRDANDLADEFDRLAGRDPASHHPAPSTSGQSEAVMRRFHAVASVNTELAQWAFRIFIARWPNADVFPMPTLRQQLAVLKKEHPQRFRPLAAAASLAVTGAPAAGEDLLRYYRQDLDLSDHHLHWHALYNWQKPTEGLQGRLFLYMHEQMLARYNTERHAAGLSLVQPFLKWDDPSSWSAAFGVTDLPVDALAPWINPAWIKRPREGHYEDFDEKGRSPLRNAGAAAVKTVLDGLRRVYDGIKNGSYANYDAVGADLEASAPDLRNDGGPHNNGHDVLAKPPDEDDPNHFVMASPEVAMTTPVFYRWHRAIDDFGWAWQESQGQDAARYVVPAARMRRGTGAAATRSPDVILAPRDIIAGIEKPGFDLDAWGETQFGGANFETVIDPARDLSELVTALRDDPAVPGLEFLSIKADWVYCLRIRNDSGADSSVTVRIWLAALDLATDRRNWIEMDKFVAAIPKGGRKVVSRGSWQSTVIRRKSVSEPMTLAETKDEFIDTGNQANESMWCECGLPYRLLLPRGTPAGMPFRFLVLLSDAQQDGTADALENAECGSVLYCGRENKTWPDNQEMGFPFHRPFSPAADPVFAHFDAKPNAVWRDIVIRAS